MKPLIALVKSWMSKLSRSSRKRGPISEYMKSRMFSSKEDPESILSDISLMEVGRVVVQMAALELAVKRLISVIITGNPTRGLPIVIDRDLRPTLEILTETIKAKPELADIHEISKKVLQRIEKLSEKRNSIVHGEWYLDPEHGVSVRRLRKAPKNTKPNGENTEIINLNVIHSWVDTIRQARAGINILSDMLEHAYPFAY